MSRKTVAIAVGCLNGGGTERVISIWAGELARVGIDVYIITYYRAPDEYAIDPRVHFRPLTQTKDEFRKLSKLKRCAGIRRILKTVSPDYVLSFLPSVQILLSIACMGLPAIRIETIRNNPWVTYGELRLFEKVLWRRCFRTADLIIVQSEGQLEYFHRSVREKCRTIANPLGEHYLCKREKKYTDRVSEFIAVGRIDEQKNYPLMIMAFSRACKVYPHIKLRIYGMGSESHVKQLSAAIAEAGMGENIFLMGRNAQIEEKYADSDIFLMSSEYEGMPNALAEAMASKLVCISTDCRTGPSDLIDDGVNGFLYPCGDEDRLTELISTACIMDRKHRQEIGERAHEKAVNLCDIRNCMQKLLMCMEEK